MKKYLISLFLVLLAVPVVAFASWWNPLSWFNGWTFHNETPPAIIQPKSPPPAITQSSLPSPKPTSETTIPTVALSIYDVSIDTSSSYASVNWKTSIPSESKVLFNGKGYFSINGIGTIHKVNLTGLQSSHGYSGSITAIANNIWVSRNFNFGTKRIPLSITITEKLCLTDNSCTIGWETNYNSNGTIEIYETSSNKMIKSENYTVDNGYEPSLDFSVTPDTDYTFRISAIDDTESTEITDDFKSNPTTPTGQTKNVDICPNIPGVQTAMPEGMIFSGVNCAKPNTPVPSNGGNASA